MAQQQPIDNSSPIPVIHVSSELVLLDAIVADRKTGQLVTTLTANDFTLEEDGIPQKIRYFSQDKLPLSIVLLFDLTQSVQPQLKSLGEGALEILQHLKPEDEVAVMTFSSSTQMLQPFTRDHQSVAAAIQAAARKKSNEGTFLDEDIYEGVDAAMQSTVSGSRRVLVFFTDGTENDANRMTRKIYGKSAPVHLHKGPEAKEKLMQTGVTVSALIDRPIADDAIIAMTMVSPLSYVFGLSPRLDHVARLAAETGGPVLHTSGKQAAAKLATLIEELRGRYTIGYVPSTPQPDGTFCHLKLKLTPAALATHPAPGHCTVQARAGYYRSSINPSPGRAK
uniref:VWFA domain-containing protein n=1 Tax=mine drainage metagenome TaxID=410659 RepID=E6QIV4_9ZZZZ